MVGRVRLVFIGIVSILFRPSISGFRLLGKINLMFSLVGGVMEPQRVEMKEVGEILEKVESRERVDVQSPR